MRRLAPLLLLAALPALAAGCAGSAVKGGGNSPVEVVAAENVWGSIAAQHGGSKVHVTSGVTSPATDPHDAAYFHARKSRFETKGLPRYKRLIATINRRYHGVPVGASESIFAPLAKALGLKLLTPSSFLKAISEGAEPTASDITTIERQ